jgi:glycine/sarcosine N-methyltransferase
MLLVQQKPESLDSTLKRRGSRTVQYYDDLADFYELIFPDWERSMARQSAAISQVLLALGPRKTIPGFRVLDVAAGIGTQALPLAALGFDVTARDLSERAIDRLRREADSRGLSIDIAQSDMRNVRASANGPFEAVIAFDNSVTHLSSDAEITKALTGFRESLVDGGLFLLSVRDYDQVDRSRNSSHPYGERIRGEQRFRLRQD